MKYFTQETNETIKYLEESNWLIQSERNSENYQVVAVAETEDQETIVILSTVVSDITKRFYFYQIMDMKLINSYGDTYVGDSIVNVIEERNEYYRNEPEFVSKYIKPIKYLYTFKKRVYVFNEKGIDLDARRFSGTLEDAVELMESLNWEMPAGTTSNCSKFYSIKAVGRTNGDEIIVIIESNGGSFGYPVIVTPCSFYIDGVAEGNYGTPTGGKSMEHAIGKFNKDVFDSKRFGCRLNQIVELITKTGEHKSVDVYKDELEMM